METRFIEATNNRRNWGKFMVAQWSRTEWERPAAMDGAEGMRLLRGIGWAHNQLIVFDLQTCEGAGFVLGPHADPRADLAKHRIWVCPLFEPFLVWLYAQRQPIAIQKLPRVVQLPDAPFEMSGHRRPGPNGEFPSS